MSMRWGECGERPEHARLGVYVGAPSSDLDRYTALVDKISTHERLYLTHDWRAPIQHARNMGWKDADCPLLFQRESAAAEVFGVREAAVFLALMPPEGVITTGLWVELGMALALRMKQGTPRIVLSSGGVRGARRQHTIFETLADFITEADDFALAVAEQLAFTVSLTGIEVREPWR